MGITTIQVSDELWEYLDDKKERGETFEDVIWELAEEAGDVDR